jgi:hypothetical protein
MKKKNPIRGIAMGASQTYPILKGFFQPKQKIFSKPHSAYPIFILNWFFLAQWVHLSPAQGQNCWFH